MPAAATTSCSATTARCVYSDTRALADRLRYVRTSDFNDGGRDRLEGGAGDDLLIGGTAGDSIDGDAGDDLIFGDQVSLERRAGAAHDPRPLPLGGDTRPRRSRRARSPTFGDDYITGGAGDDMIFGQLGNDTLLGDGALEDPLARRLAARRRRTTRSAR